MRLEELPEDLLLEITNYLSIHACLALSQSFHAAFSLSQTSVLFWRHSLTELASFLKDIKSTNNYSATELRIAAIKAHQTWASLNAPGAKKSSSFRTPVEEYRYEGVVPPGLPFYFSLATFGLDKRTHLVCRDLARDGRVIGTYEIPASSSQKFEARCLAVSAVDHQSVLVAILSQGQQSWYSPILHLIQAHIQVSPEEANADFSLVVSFKSPQDWIPEDQSKLSVRLPRSFHVYRDYVVWVQDIIDTTRKQTFVSPLVTVIRHNYISKATGKQIECQFGRWTCGRAQDLYTIGATLVVDHVILIADYEHTRAFVVSLSTILSATFDPAQIYQQISNQTPCFLPRPRDGIVSGFRVEFDSEVEPISLYDLQMLPRPSSVGFKLQAVIFANAGNANRSSTQVWWYTMYLHLLTTTAHPSATLHIPAPIEGSRYGLYISRYGLTRGLLWCVPLGSESVLFLEHNAGNRWPILRSTETQIEHFDPLSGIVCGFTDPLGDGLPFMSVSRFKGKSK